MLGDARVRQVPDGERAVAVAGGKRRAGGRKAHRRHLRVHARLARRRQRLADAPLPQAHAAVAGARRV